MNKKILLSLFIVTLLAVSLKTYAENVTVRFKAPDTWTEAAAYVWGTQEIAGGWPGQVLTKDTDGLYVFTFDNTGLTSVNLIFNNNPNEVNGTVPEKARDINGLLGGCWQAGSIVETDGDGVKIYSIARISCPGDPVNPNAITVKYKAPVTWNEVSVYVWETVGGQDNQLTGGWPGTPIGKNGEFYTYSITNNQSATVNVIFNDNFHGNQTFGLQASSNTCWEAGDIVEVDANQQNIWSADEVTCPSSGVTDLTSGFELLMFPNPTTDAVRFQTPENTTNVIIYSVTGELLGKAVPVQNGLTEIDLSGYANGLYYISVNVAGELKTKCVMKK